MKNDLQNQKQSYYYGHRPEMLKYIPTNAQKIMEVGCGEGMFCSQIRNQKQDREIWGVDINSAALQKAKTHCDKVLSGDIYDLLGELPENYFDCIVFNDVLEHLYEPWKVINFCKSILSENGVIVSSIPNFRYIHNLIEILSQQDFRYKDSGMLDITHLRFFTSKSIRRMYAEQGFTILKHEGINPKIFWKTRLLTVLSVGKLADVKYLQFATVAQPQKS